MLITTWEKNSESRKCILIKCVLVAFIVFFSCFLLFNGCGVAYAAAMSDSDKDYLSDYFGTLYNGNPIDTTLYNTFYQQCNNYDSFIVLKGSMGNMCILFNNDYPVNLPIFSGYNYTLNMPNYFSGNEYISSDNQYLSSNYESRCLIYGKYSISNKSLYSCYYFVNTLNNQFGSVKISSSSSTSYYNISNYYIYKSFTSNQYSLPNTQLKINIGDTFYTNSDKAYIYCSAQNSTNNFYKLEKNVDTSFVEDDRLKITTINDSYDNKDLVIDFTEFGTSTNAATYTYSDLILTYSIDDVSYTLTNIDSYIEQIGDVQGLIDVMAFIPFIDFETFTDYNNVILTNVTFTRTISSAGGSGSETFRILTNYYINKSTSESGMENIDYSTDVSGEKATQEQIDTIYYNINFVEGTEISFDEMYEGENTFPSNWSDHYVYLKNVTASWNEVFEDLLLTPSEAYDVITETCVDTDSAIKRISTYLYTSNIASTFDVIIFDYIQETSSSYTHTYWYYTTVCGRIRAMSSIAADLYVDTNQIAVNTKETYNYLKLRLDDFEDKSLNKLDNIISNCNSTLSWLHTIDFDLSNGFNSVVNAINNIDVPEQDNSDIINKLSDVISAINNIGSPVSANEIDTPQECIEYYRDNINTDIEDIPLQYRVAYFEGMTLDKLYTYGINSNGDTLLASTSDSQYTDQSIFIIKYFYDTILDVMNNSSMYNNLVEGINALGDSSTYFYDMFDSDFDITVYHGFR